MSTKTEPAPTSPTAAAGTERNDRIRLVAVLVAIGGAVLLAIMAVALMSEDDETATTTGAGADASGDDWGGALMAPGQPRPDFTLTDTAGRPYDFAAETGGELTLLFFGYTNCPDICPVQMAVLSDALDTPGVPRANVVFVTTDPDRDTPERLRHWLDQFPGGEGFVGLRGTVEQVAEAETAADVPVSTLLPDDDGNGDDYEVGHAAQIMAYTPDDKAHLAYPSGVRSEDWIADLPRMMERWGSGSDPAAPAPEDDDADATDGAGTPAVRVGDITVSDGFAAASDDTTAVYVTIDNAGDGDTLVGVSSPAAADITLMGGADGAGMEETDSVEVPNGTTAFAAGGGHIMVDLDEALEAGDTLPLELEFADAGTVTVDVEILSWDAMVDRIESSANSGSSGSSGS